MKLSAKRGVAAIGTVAVAAAINIVTGLVGQHWALAWWLSLAVLVVLGGGLQWWLTELSGAERPTDPADTLIQADGVAALASGGKISRVKTVISFPADGSAAPELADPSEGGGVISRGAGSMAARGDIADADIEVKRPESA